MTQPWLNVQEFAVLKVLASEGGDFNYFSFAPLSKKTRLPRARVRRACRSLARKGLAVFSSALCTDDGAFYGAGYAATAAGRARICRKAISG